MLDVKVKEDIAKEGCCGTYFPPLPHSSPLVSGQGTAVVQVFFLEMNENPIGPWLCLPQGSYLQMSSPKGRTKASRTIWILMDYR